MVKGSRVWLKNALVVPNYQLLRLRLLQEFHKIRLAGHPGAKAIFKALSEYYWWSRQRDDVQRFAKNCHHYRRYKPYSEQKQGLLQPLPIAQQKWLHVTLDFAEKLPPCIRKNREFRHCLVMVDRLTKGRIYEPLETLGTEEVVEALSRRLFCVRGFPLEIVSD